MATFADPVTNLSLPRRRSDPAHIEDRCYGSCNAAFIKGQVSRDWEDFCASGSAFYDYYHSCLCCVGGDLRAKNSRENAADYLAADFAGILTQCGDTTDNPYPRVADPCSVPKHEIVSKVSMTPFPTATVQTIYPPTDSLSVGVSITVPLRQLRPGQAPLPTTSPANQYTEITHTTTALVTTTDAQNHVVAVPSTARGAQPVQDHRHGRRHWRRLRVRPASPNVAALLAAAAAQEEEKGAGAPVGRAAAAGESFSTSQMGRATAGGQDGWGSGDKAQLHSESVPTRELDSREIPSPPVELPANEVVPRSGGVLASVQEEELPLGEVVAESDEALAPSHEDAPAEDMSKTHDVSGSLNEEYVLAEEAMPEPDDAFVSSREDLPVEEPSKIEDESVSSKVELPVEEQ
ncbi:hypothetical protein PG999_001923 [Apiospora kogelbergensis]|uniref:Uncharacterized protein n=1 Tax=Apiospora kogelbergensis TaxID=1337665 RepID=A0AAW0R6Z7_9PEZI